MKLLTAFRFTDRSQALGPRVLQAILAGIGDFFFYKFALKHFKGDQSSAAWTVCVLPPPLPFGSKLTIFRSYFAIYLAGLCSIACLGPTQTH